MAFWVAAFQTFAYLLLFYYSEEIQRKICLINSKMMTFSSSFTSMDMPSRASWLWLFQNGAFCGLSEEMEEDDFSETGPDED